MHRSSRPRTGRALWAESPGQQLALSAVPDGDSVFVSNARVVNLVRRSRGGEVRLRIGADIGWASKCGERIIGSQSKNGTERTVWLDSDGRIGGTLADDTVSPRCSSDGRTMFWTVLGQTPGVQRCDGTNCRTLFKGDAALLSLSPDDKRLAFLTRTESRARHTLDPDRRSGWGPRGLRRRHGMRSGLVE